MNKNSEMELSKEILDRLKAMRREIAITTREIEQEWVEAFHKNSYIDYSHVCMPLRKYFDEVGGFRIKEEEWNLLSKPQQAFFKDRAKWYNGFINFRGYKYYSADPCMYLSDNCPKPHEFWISIIKKIYTYNEYLDILDFDLSCKMISFHDWLASISFIEWIFNDLCSIAWTYMVLKRKRCKLSVEGLDGFDKVLDIHMDNIAQVLTNYSYFIWREKRLPKPTKAINTIKKFLNDPRIIHFCNEVESFLRKKHEKGWVRSVREGDQLWIVLSSFEKRFLQTLNNKKNTNIMLLSNAFGAIHTGSIWKSMVNESQKALIKTQRVWFSFHEDEMNRFDNILDSLETIHILPFDLIIHIDDSIFTGKTHKMLVDSIGETNASICIAPLTFDIGTVYNHPNEMLIDGMTLKQRLDMVERMARKLGGGLGVARSYWAYNKRLQYKKTITNTQYLSVVNGSDLLLRMLYERFEDEILDNEVLENSET
ncbi:hypothetical protein HZI73_16790 [Vallitalea pronyensis]|uniref:Uncharacterized protein n=1 Tax=Vallitalea pronyensis TaxID=1348613 RepID=A0A8J8SHW4_9FIRM|nr:hypothetical protein [Vallitalea pronyensis]QUI23849.1 hypothetical protein HZI73_16790 [Vallitalea pronyensis]